MAVTNFHYITRMSSGFKVYILEGQPNLRTEDRYRHMTNEKARISPAYPMKRQHSPDRRPMADERRHHLEHPEASVPHSPAHSSLNSTPSPNHGHLSPAHTSMYATPPMEQPLALVKRPRRDWEGPDHSAPHRACSQVQIRPSVITRVSSTPCSAQRSPPVQHHGHSASVMSSPVMSSPVTSSPAYDHVVEEHFRRSLGVNYHKKANSCQLSVSVSVDDHFAKALGEKWFQLKASSSCSSSSSHTTSDQQSTTSFCSSPNESQNPDDPIEASESAHAPPHASPWSDAVQAAPNQ
ncbi:hypothetical protein AAFF_G00295000 [Aldrovandia affinis]|uniref:Vestigial n=1 Tax=Aldrovandia affinis TaxID=143900 RepID=A0AAD7RBJ0_9TELE|nr:hypothetical protein AAFF_G00295000 [Aldrovandia affinis]